MLQPSTSISSDSQSRPLLRGALTAIGVVGLLLWLTTCVLFVDETEVVIVERLGQIVAVFDQQQDRGLQFKLPWPIGIARRFDQRTQLLSPPGREMFTRDRKNITVDAFVCWRIAETASESPLAERPAVRFFRALGSVETAQARLETRLRSALASRIAQIELTDLMQITDPQTPVTDLPVSLDAMAMQLLDDVRRRPDEDQSTLDRMGVEVVDVRIRRLNFPVGNQQAVFERMKSERQKIADRYRSAGLAENSMIRSQADRQHSEIISKAEAEAERVRGRAEAEALTILNTAYARDPEFAQVVRSLDAARKVLNDRTTLVLSASSSFLKLLIEGVPAGALTTPAPQAPEVKSPDVSAPAGEGQP